MIGIIVRQTWQQKGSRGWEPTVDSLSTMGRAELGGGRVVRVVRWAGPHPKSAIFPCIQHT